METTAFFKLDNQSHYRFVFVDIYLVAVHVATVSPAVYRGPINKDAKYNKL